MIRSRTVLGGLFLALFFFTFCVPAWSAAKKPGRNNARGAAGGKNELNAMNVYATVLPEKTLLTSPRFKLVDDFNGREWKNRLDGFWRLENAMSGPVAMEHPREDARNPRSGHSLKTVFDLKDRQRFTISSSLEKLDMSQARFLASKCKVTPLPKGTFHGSVRVALTDWTGKSADQDITGICAESGKWNDAILPMEAFKGLDLDQLAKISFTVANTGKRSRAALWLDEIAFFGNNEVGFESTLDNIRGFPLVVCDSPAKEELLTLLKDREFIDRIGRSTWRYFEDAINKESNLVLDHVKVGDFPMAGIYTSPTNIAMDLLSNVAARELGYVSGGEAEKRVNEILAGLGKLKKYKGFFYNFYETTRFTVNREFISSVDNGWLAAALIVVRQAFPGKTGEEATKILKGFRFQDFWDPDTNHIAIGFDIKRNSLTPYHYGMLVTEARVMSFIGIGKGDLPKDHWWYLYRTAPDAWDWQTQKPYGKWVKQDGVEYFQGHYLIGERKVVPSWGGSLFEFLMPTLVIPEKKLAPRGLGLNNKVATEIHRSYALEERQYPVWGISPAATSNGRRWQYGEYGVKKLGVKGYPDKEIVAPYASFLALETLPDEAVKNLRKLLSEYNIYGEYGFYDSVDLRNGQVTHQYLALDQGMAFIAIANYLKNGVIQDYFMKDPIAEKARELLEEEIFF